MIKMLSAALFILVVIGAIVYASFEAPILKLTVYLNGAGAAEAADELGDIWAKDNAPGHDEKAVSWYLKAAQMGNIPAKYSLAVHYDEGKGVPQNKPEATRLFREVRENGGSVLPTVVGEMYEVGIGGGRDITNAVRYYKLAVSRQARHGSLAEFRLGYIYFAGDGLAVDYQQGVKYLSETTSITKYAVVSQTLLGRAYGEGLGVEKDPLRSCYWYKQAADHDTSEHDDIPYLTNARYGWALCLVDGTGTKATLSEARQWMTKAAGGNGDYLLAAKLWLTRHPE